MDWSPQADPLTADFLKGTRFSGSKSVPHEKGIYFENAVGSMIVYVKNISKGTISPPNAKATFIQSAITQMKTIITLSCRYS